MRKLFTLLLFCASASMPTKSNAASPAATQAWVRRYIETNALSLAASTRSATSNNVVTASAGEGEDQVIVRVEEFSDAALFVTNSQTAAVTDGTRFVWDGNGAYICAAGTIVSTRTNLVWGGVGSHFTNGVIRFEGAFDCRPILIQQSTSLAITNGLAAAWGDVRPRWYERVADVLAELIVPSACADLPAPDEWYEPDEGWNTDVGESLNFLVYDAKENDYTDVEIKTSVNEDGTRYIKNEDIRDAFSGLTKNIDTALSAVGVALDGIIKVESQTMYNSASIKKLADTIYNHAAMDLKSDSNGNLTWTASGSSGGAIKKFEVPKYTVNVTSGLNYYLMKDDKEIGEPWNSTIADGNSLESFVSDGVGKIRLRGWDTHDLGSAFKVADVLTADSEDTTSRVLVYNGGKLNFWSLGKLDNVATGVTANVVADGVTVVTNAPGREGELALSGFHDEAEQGSVPFADGENLKWTPTPTKGAILAGSSDLKVEWKSTDVNSRYYGTSDSDTTLGFYDLPNVTTNRVEGDEKTITTVENADGVKKLGLYSSPLPLGEDGRLSGAYMEGDRLVWAKIPNSSTNETGVATDNHSITTNREGTAIQIAGFDEVGSGLIGKFGDNTVRYSKLVGTNSIYSTETTSGEREAEILVGLDGWESPQSGPHGCAESIAAMLRRSEGETLSPEQDPSKHLVLTRYSGGTVPVMHFTPIGSLGAVGGGAAIKFVGTSGEAVVGSGPTTNTVTFASATDSNVEVSVTSDENGNATVTFGVYYK